MSHISERDLEYQRMEEELRRMKEELARAKQDSKAKDDYLASYNAKMQVEVSVRNNNTKHLNHN
jgi:HEPN domain-containing protein